VVVACTERSVHTVEYVLVSLEAVHTCPPACIDASTAAGRGALGSTAPCSGRLMPACGGWVEG
jgi:hypothetical protein